MSDKNQSKELTNAEKMWEFLKDKDLAMFSLPSQTVEQYCLPILLDPDKLMLLPKASSVLPALEEAFGKQFTFEMADKYIIVNKKVV